MPTATKPDKINLDLADLKILRVRDFWILNKKMPLMQDVTGTEKSRFLYFAASSFETQGNLQAAINHYHKAAEQNEFLAILRLAIYYRDISQQLSSHQIQASLHKSLGFLNLVVTHKNLSDYFRSKEEVSLIESTLLYCELLGLSDTKTKSEQLAVFKQCASAYLDKAIDQSRSETETRILIYCNLALAYVAIFNKHADLKEMASDRKVVAEVSDCVALLKEVIFNQSKTASPKSAGSPRPMTQFDLEEELREDSSSTSVVQKSKPVPVSKQKLPEILNTPLTRSPNLGYDSQRSEGLTRVSSKLLILANHPKASFSPGSSPMLGQDKKKGFFRRKKN